MSNKIQIRRGTNIERTAVTLDSGEPAWTTDTKALYMGDGSTAGGIKISGAPTTSDWTVYVATTAYGGSSGGSGIALQSGTATGTSSGKLIDSGGGFSSAVHLNKTVYNATDNTWAKITAVDSSTQLSLSADIMVSGESYVIADAVDTIQGGLNAVENPFYANPTVRVSDGTFTGDVEAVGISPAGAYTLTLQGSTSGTTTISGLLTIRQRITIKNVTIKNRVFLRSGADVTWNTVTGSGGSALLFRYAGSSNDFTSCTLTFGNDPGPFTEASSTITKGYSLYAASSTYGGSTANDGLKIREATLTSVAATKLNDTNANFLSGEVLSMGVWNVTRNTWHKVSTVNSTTQLTVSGSTASWQTGDTYIIFAPYTSAQTAVNQIPGQVYCDTVVQCTPETFSESVTIQGKAITGNFTITLRGAKSIIDSGTVVTATSGSTTVNATMTDSSKSWTTNTHYGAMLIFDDATATANLRGECYMIKSNTATVLTIINVWYFNFTDTPTSSDTYKIVRPGTTFTGQVLVTNGQKNTDVEFIICELAGSPARSIEYNNSAGGFIRYCESDMVGVRWGASVTILDCYIHGTFAGVRNLFIQLGAVVELGSVIIDGEAGGLTCIEVNNASLNSYSAAPGHKRTWLVYNSTARGLYVLGTSSCSVWLYSGFVRRHQFETLGTGVDVKWVAQCAYANTTYIDFTTVTTPTQEDTATSGHIV